MCSLSEGYIRLIPLQVQGKVSARLKTCSAAQVRHVAMSHKNKDGITDLWKKMTILFLPCGLHILTPW